MRPVAKGVGLVLAVVLLPAAAYAQASLAGQVKDVSGAVLPGVTVEAASAALIEKVRTAVTDGGGQYRVEILPPGTYSLTFTLPGFNTVKREGIQLSGTFTATIDAELRVGAIEETITVTGETPIVDVQSGTRQRVIDRDLIDGLPTGRTPFAQMALIPGVSVGAANQDVGGATQLSGAIGTQIHGSTQNSQLLMENGLSTAVLVAPWGSQLSFNMAATQEIAVNYSGSGAENNASGVQMNVIPREGGNTFNGVFFVNGTSGGLQGSNFSQELKDAGLRTPDSIRTLYDVNPGFGGPLRRDRLWFYASARRAVASRWAAEEFYDRNANNPNVWIYDPDLTRPVSNDSDVNDGRLRLTWQATPKVKLGGLYVQQTARNWPTVRDASGRGAGATLSAYEASPYHYFPVERQMTADATSPITSRLLVDGAFKYAVERAIRDRIPALNPQMIAVLDQATGREYRARSQDINRPSYTYYYRASVSYITGAHSFKVGIGDITGYFNQNDYDNNPVSYRFNNGVPNQITMRALPIVFRVDVDHQMGAYVQDRWTVDRLTLNLGLRYDRFQNSFPAQEIGPSALAPARGLPLRENGRGFVPRPESQVERGLRSAGRRQHGGEGQPQPVGRAVHLRRTGRRAQPDHPPRELNHPVVERRQHEFHSRLQSSQPGCQRRMRRGREPGVRQSHARTELRPRHPVGLGEALLRLGTHRRRAEGNRAACLGRRHLFQAVVRQLHGGRQPRGHGIGLHAVQHHGALRSTAAGRRSIPGYRAVRRQSDQVRSD